MLPLFSSIFGFFGEFIADETIFMILSKVSQVFPCQGLGVGLIFNPDVVLTCILYSRVLKWSKFQRNFK